MSRPTLPRSTHLALVLAACALGVPASAQTHLSSFERSNGQVFDGVGGDVARDGTAVFLGTDNDEVDVCQLNGDQLAVVQTLTSPIASPPRLGGFGRSVDAAAGVLVVGAPAEPAGNRFRAGRVYVYRVVAGSWQLAETLDGSLDAGEFGSAVSLSPDGQALLVASPFEGATGTTRWFGFDGTSWQEEFRHAFAGNVLHDGDRVFVSNPASLTPGQTDSIFYFRRENGRWRQIQRLDAFSSFSMNLGFSMAVDGDLFVAGMPGYVTGGFGQAALDRTGGAVVYRLVEATGRWDREAVLFDRTDDGAGVSVAIDADSVLVGDAVFGRQGRVTVHRDDGNGWQPKVRIAPPVSRPNQRFGQSLLVEDGLWFVGANGDSGAGGLAGAVHVMRADLNASRRTFDVDAGGSVVFDVRFEDALAGAPFILLGSASGRSPGIGFGGGTVPLQADSYTNLLLTLPNSAVFAGTLGRLDSEGAATMALTLPAGLTGLRGLDLDHAVAVVPPGGSLVASRPLTLAMR